MVCASFRKRIPGHGCPGLSLVCVVKAELCELKDIQIDTVLQRSEDAVEERGDRVDHTGIEIAEAPQPVVADIVQVILRNVAHILCKLAHIAEEPTRARIAHNGDFPTAFG